AGVLFGNGPAFGEGRAGELNGHSNLLLFNCASIVVAGASDAEKREREYGAARYAYENDSHNYLHFSNLIFGRYHARRRGARRGAAGDACRRAGLGNESRRQVA